MNLLLETEQEIRACSKSISDIAFIGSACGNYECSWDEFKIIADFDYYNWCDSQEIAQDLVIVFWDGSKLFRTEFNGYEGWQYQPAFVKSACPNKIKNLRTDYGAYSIQELNR